MDVPLKEKKGKDNKIVSDKESKEEGGGKGEEGGGGAVLPNYKDSG